MTQDEFPAELVGRIAADLNLGSRYDAQRIVIAVLRASKHAELVAALDGVVNDVQAWCDAIENNGTGWDDWDHHYKNFAYRGGLVRARTALAAAGQPQGSEE